MSRRFPLVVIALGLLACSSDGASNMPTEEPGDEPELPAVQDGGRASDAARAARDTGIVDGEPNEPGEPQEPAEDAGREPELDAGPTTGGSDAGRVEDAGTREKFSFFVTSLSAMRRLSENQNGFGGDLRHGETGEGAGLRGADKICTEIAETSMPGAGKKGWRAFLSTTKGGSNNGAVHAIERIGSGPWYDRLGRVVSKSLADLAMTRPVADNAIRNDLPNEDGVPNHNPDGTGNVDNHHVLTGSNTAGKLHTNDLKVTCADWTKSTRDSADAPRVGLSWPRGTGGGVSAQHWISALDEAGCGVGAKLNGQGGPVESDPTVGSGGGYGALYCFALEP